MTDITRIDKNFAVPVTGAGRTIDEALKGRKE